MCITCPPSVPQVRNNLSYTIWSVNLDAHRPEKVWPVEMEVKLGCDALVNMETVEGGQIYRFAVKNAEENNPALQEAKGFELSREDILFLYSEYAPSVYNFFYYSTGDRDASMDLVNDVFVKVLDKSGQFDERKGDIRTWLFTVARNTQRDYFKSRRRARPHLTIDEAREVPAAGYANPEETAALKDDILALTKALEALNKRERSLISLKYGAGFRNKDIAKMLDLRERHVGVILCRALSKLRKQLEDGR